MENEEARIQQEGSTALMYVESAGWELVKAKFTEKIMDLQSIKNLVGTKSEELLADIKARNTAIDILIEIQQDIEGKAEQFKNNRIPENPESDIVLRT